MAKQKIIPKRSEVEKQYTWATEDLFATDELWEKSLEELKAYPEKIAAFKGKISASPEALLDYFKLSDELSVKVERLGNYAMRKSDEDTGNSFYQAMKGKVMNLYMMLGSADAFATPEIISIPDEKMAEFYTAVPGLELYRRPIEKTRHFKPHSLSDAEERILALSGQVTSAPGETASAFRNADLKFPDITDSEGNVLKVTQGSYVPLLENPDQNVRKAAFESLYHTFESFKNTSAAFLDSQVKGLIFNAQARNYESTLHAALDRTEVPVSVYHNLIEAVHNNLHYLHKYVELRKKLMGLDELHMYDLYTPIVGDADKEIPYEEAKEIILKALKPLGEEYLDILREGFNNRWIDVYENEGKRSGAYSSCGDPHPYVLLNQKDTLDSMFTIAHEMGHSLHTYYSMKNQPVCQQDYVIFVAEVASTCNEVLLVRYLLNNTTDKRERAYLINHFLESFRGTVYRQTMFAEFELFMNQLAETGVSLTADALCKKYYELNKQYFGDAIVADPEIAYEWERIPHFFYNFYVFQYATGFSAACAIANRILTEGEPAVKDYKKFLSAGGSTDPITILKYAGVDMTTAKPVNEALKLFGELLDEMEELLK
ncbi:MAG: oligoendopeptidase F [Clostridiales bacterium]|nr:oligoendopeptidase F [Clostridiales bacterium]